MAGHSLLVGLSYCWHSRCWCHGENARHGKIFERIGSRGWYFDVTEHPNPSIKAAAAANLSFDFSGSSWVLSSLATTRWPAHDAHIQSAHIHGHCTTYRRAFSAAFSLVPSPSSNCSFGLRTTYFSLLLLGVTSRGAGCHRPAGMPRLLLLSALPKESCHTEQWGDRSGLWNHLPDTISHI